jgi:hypothetical protein
MDRRVGGLSQPPLRIEDNGGTMKSALLLIVAFLPLAAAAQVTPDPALLAIQDNSFLLEEAYNQDPGVVQHISTFLRDHEGDGWAFAFTQEWPAPSLKHQLSYTIPIVGDGSSGLGDIMLNYRYQLLGDGDATLAISPRFSVILPTGDEERGGGTKGVQVALPISRVLAPRIAAHTNLGATWLADDGGTSWFAGQSVVYAASERMNFFLEGVYTHADGSNAFLLSPALRFSFPLKNGVQMVPGIGVPIGFGDDDSRSVLLYLSFEK